MNLDINSAVQTAFYILLLAAVLSIWVGWRTYRSGSNRRLYYRQRQERMNRGIRLFFFAVVFFGAAFLLNRYAEPVIYQVFPPSPTPTNTATVTLTPTITPTATITITPSITPTTSITPTPFIPTELFAQFTATVTANPNAVFSRPQFTREVKPKTFQPVEPQIEFANPITKLYATFSFDKMNTGAQWTALWVRLSDQKIICAETEAWTGGTGGYGYSLCQPDPSQWTAGEYEFHMFTGVTYKITGRFSITGTPPTVTPSITPTPTRSLTPTPTTTFTPTPTWTPVPSWTPIPSLTHAPTWTPSLTFTPSLTYTPVPSWTPEATR